MTTTEQIVWAHRVDKDLKAGELTPGGDAARLRGSAAGVGRHRAVRDPHVQPDHRRQHDLSRGRRRSRTTTSCSPAAPSTTSRPASAASSRGCRTCSKPYYATPGRRHLPFLFPRAGAGHAGAVHPRRGLAQPRLRRVRRGRHRRRLDDARLRMGDGLHLLHAGEGAPRRVRRPAPALGQRQGHRPRAAAALGREAVAGHVGRTRRRATVSCRSRTATRSPT